MIAKPSINDFKAMQRRAYVDNVAGNTKVIFGKDEWQIVFNLTSAIEAKRRIANGDFSVKNVEPAVIDDNVLAIRAELNRLEAQLSELYANEPKQEGFLQYSAEFRRKTDSIAYTITNVLTCGRIKSVPEDT